MKLSVQYMSFSAHADAKGIMQLIRQVNTICFRQFLCVRGDEQQSKYFILCWVKKKLYSLTIQCRTSRKRTPARLQLGVRLREVLTKIFGFQAEPKNVVLVHGEAGKMDFLKQKIEKEFGESSL